jgi:hypothetical protein
MAITLRPPRLWEQKLMKLKKPPELEMGRFS